MGPSTIFFHRIPLLGQPVDRLYEWSRARERRLIRSQLWRLWTALQRLHGENNLDRDTQIAWEDATGLLRELLYQRIPIGDLAENRRYLRDLADRICHGLEDVEPGDLERSLRDLAAVFNHQIHTRSVARPAPSHYGEG